MDLMIIFKVLDINGDPSSVRAIIPNVKSWGYDDQIKAYCYSRPHGEEPNTTYIRSYINWDDVIYFGEVIDVED